MKIDVTLKITPKMAADAQGNEKKVLVGHLGTHFDVMNKEFPLELIFCCKRIFPSSAWILPVFAAVKSILRKISTVLTGEFLLSKIYAI